MQEIRSSNPLVVTGVYDPNKSRARHHRSLKIGSKLKYLNIKFFFFFNMKLCLLTLSSAVISNMTIAFSNYRLEVPQIRHFWSQTHYFLFYMNLGFSTNSVMLNSNIKIVFQIRLQKYPNKGILVPDLFFFFNMKPYIYTNSKVLVSNMTIVCPNFSPKISK